MPPVEFEHLKFAPEPESENEVCEHCGHVHSYEYDDEFDDDEISDQPGFDDEQIESETADAAALIRCLPSIPVEQLDACEPADTFVLLREEGLTREEAIVMPLETMAKEVTRPGGESKPDAARLTFALARLRKSSAHNLQSPNLHHSSGADFRPADDDKYTLIPNRPRASSRRAEMSSGTTRSH